ncbi:hypothetical protein FB451DRAFT_1170525 [Mycena latifolia]|nr:hypothetical protein FB451DRAFT_1170525 [Mycena latifolia]
MSDNEWKGSWSPQRTFQSTPLFLLRLVASSSLVTILLPPTWLPISDTCSYAYAAYSLQSLVLLSSEPCPQLLFIHFRVLPEWMPMHEAAVTGVIHGWNIIPNRCKTCPPFSLVTRPGYALLASAEYLARKGTFHKSNMMGQWYTISKWGLSKLRVHHDNTGRLPPRHREFPFQCPQIKRALKKAGGSFDSYLAIALGIWLREYGANSLHLWLHHHNPDIVGT